MKNEHDIIVLGSGIAGSIVALVLRRVGLNVLVVERKTHPRFVIGESTLPTTSLILNHLAHTYDVPELAQVSHYLTLRENDCAAWPKQHFWYGTHRDGQPLEPRHEHLFEGLLLPTGPDVHMLRADADAFLASRLEKYGIEYVENTELVDFRSEPGGVRVQLQGPEGPREVTARMVVDATGHTSFLANRFGLRDEDATLHTNTRSIFGHFSGVRDLDEALGGRNARFRFRRSGGTMHHCFRGGWIWVIPFDNDVTSVGIQLDRRIYPLDERITPEEEMARVLARFPSVTAHFKDMKPVRPLIRTDRIQFTSKTILGEGFILTPHAGAFIEPLFSTGILLTVSFVARFAEAARAAHAENDWHHERFRFVERNFFAEVHHIDKLVNGMVQSFRDYDLFKQYWRNWVMGTFAQWCTSALAGGATTEVPFLYGSALPGYIEHLNEMHALVCREDQPPAQLAKTLKERIEPWWEKICSPVVAGYGDLSVGADDSLCVRGAGRLDLLMARLKSFAEELHRVEPRIDYRNAEAWMKRTEAAMATQHERYATSKREGTDYHRAYEQILANQNPDTFDYAAAVGLKT